MSGHPDKSFSETEKVVLLAEIIKSSNIPSAALLSLIITYQVEPEWTEIQRPPGRLLRDCQRAFSELRAQTTSTPYPSDPRNDPSIAYQARSYQEAGSSIGRSIVPRPLGMPPGVYPSQTPYVSPSAAEPPRKRGRPSNADLEARRQRAEALGEPYPQPSRSKAKGKATSRLSLPPAGAQLSTPSQSEPPITAPGSASSTSAAPFTQTSRPETASASPTPYSGESAKRPRPPEGSAEERKVEPQQPQPEARRPEPPASRGPRFPSADVFHTSSQQPWSATASPQPVAYPQRSHPPPQPMTPQTAGSQDHSAGRMSPPRPPDRR